MMPEIRGVLETSLYVSELERSRSFYTHLFGLRVLVEDDRLCALGVCGHQVLLLFLKGAIPSLATPGGTIPGHHGEGSLHVAFAIGRDDLDPWERRLQQEGIPVESRVQWPRGGKSVYLRDPDGHLIELATPGLWAIY
jgi:catechol 2,3-dioxygenase-like lactoylglutathione lyase family enzyme